MRKFFILPILIPLLIYMYLILTRPYPNSVERVITPGIIHKQIRKNTPRPVMLHIVTVDLKQNENSIVISRGEGNGYFRAENNCSFVERTKAAIAINGGLFTPFYVSNPLSFFPKTGDRVEAQGQVISGGIHFSEPKDGWPVLCFAEDKKASIARFACPENTYNAMPGINHLVSQGLLQKGYETGPPALYEPRTAVGIDETGYILKLLVVDGRQWFYSEGLSSYEVAQVLVDDGARDVIEFDGGGSSSLSQYDKDSCEKLNAPIHTGIPMRQRPIALHLGIQYLR
jgi:Phosphodiester glycosidase